MSDECPLYSVYVRNVKDFTVSLIMFFEKL